METVVGTVGCIGLICIALSFKARKGGGEDSM